MRHRPLQKELVCIIPPSFTVAPCDNRTAHLPERFHGFLLRRVYIGRRRIPWRLAAKSQWASPPREGKFTPAGAAKFVICDDTIEVFVQDWKSHEGWGTLTKQPGEEGACRSVILSLLVDHCLFFHPDQHAQFRNNLPAYTVGSLRANVQVECLVDVIQELVSSADPQSYLHRFTQALHEVFVFEHSKKHLVQRQLGRLESTPSLKYRVSEVMRNMPALST
jgi:hypothetical protein